MDIKQYLVSFLMSLISAFVLSYILYIHYKSFGAFLFNFMFFLIFSYRTIEILITKKSIPMLRLFYGTYREGHSTIIDFISYLIFIILFFVFGVIK